MKKQFTNHKSQKNKNTVQQQQYQRDNLKVLGNKFAYKSSPKRLLTFGLFCKRSINVKTALHILYATFLIQHMVTLD